MYNVPIALSKQKEKLHYINNIYETFVFMHLENNRPELKLR